MREDLFDKFELRFEVYEGIRCLRVGIVIQVEGIVGLNIQDTKLDFVFR